MSNLFWKEGEGATLSEIEKLPQDWKAPDLGKLPQRLEGLIAVDLETNDLGLQQSSGPGWAWDGGGHVVGISFAADNWSGYLPIAHEGGGNLDPEKVKAIANKWLGDPNQDKVGANVLYDMGWCKRLGVNIKGRVFDIQWAEALLDEHRYIYTRDFAPNYLWEEGENNLSYSLNSLSKSYLQQGKDEGLLRQAASAWGVDPKSGLWRLPAAFVGPYAEADADRTRRVFLLQKPKLEAANLWKLFELECSLLPLYLSMRWRGVRINTSRAEELRTLWIKTIKDNIHEIKRRTGVDVDLWAAGTLAKAFDKEGIKYERTEKTGAPSVRGEWLEAQDHWLTKLIFKSRQLDKLVGTFIEGHLLGHIHNGRIHGEFHPLKSGSSQDNDLRGTISGRLSSSNPNLQQIPTRSEEGQLIRGCFLPEEGEQWYSLDYSQQEPRLTVHYAASVKRNGAHLPGSLEAVEKYIKDPNTNFHKLVAAETGLSYKDAKILNLALTYGRGSESTAKELGVSVEEAKVYIQKYHTRVPYVKILDNILGLQVEKNGFLKTLYGRKCRFPFYEIAEYGIQQQLSMPLPQWLAKKRWPGKRLRRAWMHKKLNRLIQGAAADQTKLAMRDVWNAGLGDKVLIQVHDEICFSFLDPKDAQRAKDCMVNAVTLKVPTIVDIDAGPNWGEAKEVPF